MQILASDVFRVRMTVAQIDVEGYAAIAAAVSASPLYPHKACQTRKA
jgi:hypothetical protein